jgi:hypothetical protein
MCFELDELTIFFYRYYEKQGFVRLGDVEDDGWPATVLERRVKASVA